MSKRQHLITMQTAHCWALRISKEPYDMSKEPYKEPYNMSKEPCKIHKSPKICQTKSMLCNRQHSGHSYNASIVLRPCHSQPSYHPPPPYLLLYNLLREFCTRCSFKNIYGSVQNMSGSFQRVYWDFSRIHRALFRIYRIGVRTCPTWLQVRKGTDLAGDASRIVGDY